MDGSPIIDRTPVDGLYLNGGWCYGGFKATPASGWCFAHLIAQRRAASRSRRAFRLDRFATGRADRREGQRRPAQPALRVRAMLHPLSLLRSARRDEFTYRGDASVRAPATRAPDAARRFNDYVYVRDNPGRLASANVAPRAAAAAALARCAARDNTRTHEIPQRRRLSARCRDDPEGRAGDDWSASHRARAG